MHTYILRRLLMFIPVMLAVYTLVFIVMHATPGGLEIASHWRPYGNL